MSESEQKTKEKKFVGVDFEKCTGCRVCELVCALQKENSFDPKLSRIKVLRLHELVNLPVACRLCEDAPCVRSCPRDALTQDEQTGVVSVDDSKCDMCGWCIEACKYGAMFLSENKKTVKVCDLCKGTPQCIDWCPEGALSLMTQQEFDEKTREATVKKLIPQTWKGEENVSSEKA